ncbi:MAG: CpaF family protein [Bryobacteraceae bacterium]
MSFDLILPFLRPIEHLIMDSSVSEIMVNGADRVFVERGGFVEPVKLQAPLTERSLQVAIRNIARILGDEISDVKPLLDARLPDGSRVAAVFPPCAVQGTTLTIRKFHSKHFTAEELVRIGALPPEVLEYLRDGITRRLNILISGGTGTGKTTMLNALAHFIDATDRIVLIEDTAEIQIDQQNLVRFEARREQLGIPAVTIRDLLKATLRHRPDRIILGEVRGGEAFDLLQALNTGHSGSLSTIHANSAQQAIQRFTSCVLQSTVELPYKAVRSNIAECLNLLLHIERRQGKRYVSQLVELERYNPEHDTYDLRTLYQRG